MKTYLLLIAIVFLFTGCTGLQFNDYEKYTDALSSHSASESDRIMEQSQSIADVAESTETDTKIEGVLLSVIAMQQIANLEPVKLNIERPITGMEVLKDGMGNVPFVATVGGMYKLGEAGIKAAGNITLGDNANLNDSLNDTTTNATGSGNTATPTQTSDKSSETVTTSGQ